VLPITSDPDRIKSEIAALTTQGATAGHLGIEWSWYLISPDWASVWPSESAPAAYDAPDTRKAVILMTDGEFNRRYDNSQGSSDDQARTACQNMRDQGIRIYAVAFQAPAAGQEILQDCAASPLRFFSADNAAELEAAYAEIATTLNELRLTE
ncbi:MAG: VWA domain-containing protein, partial [Pseudomonadota bacterium]